MEVGPTCHYVMGGVEVAPDTAASSVPGLFAAGEVSAPVDSPVVRAAVEAWEDLGRDDAVVYPTIGGSGPTALISTELGIPTIMTGNVAHAGSRIHSPNESVRLDDYFEAINYFVRFFERFGRGDLS